MKHPMGEHDPKEIEEEFFKAVKRLSVSERRSE